MQSENTQKNQSNDDSSLMQNHDLVIAPQGGSKDDQNNGESPIQLDVEKPTILGDFDEPLEKPKKSHRTKQLFNFKLRALKEKIKTLKPVVRQETISRKLFIFQLAKNHSVAASLVKNLFYAVVSFGLFAGTIYLTTFAYSTQKQDLDLVTALEVGQQITKGEIHLIGNGVLRLNDNSSLKVDLINEEAKLYEFTLESGQLWGNTQFDDYDLTVNTETALIRPNNSSFNLAYDGSVTTVYSDKHDVYVAAFADDQVINEFWVAEANKAQLQSAKIKQKADTIKKLLYSKLVKEFGYGRLSIKKLKDDPWLSKQISEDADFSESIEKNHSDELRDQGLKTLSTGSIRFQTKELLADLRGALTFSENKKIELALDTMFENISDAEYLYFQGEDIDANVRLTLFAQDIKEPVYLANQEFNKELFNRLNAEKLKLSYVSPGDNLYPVKEAIYEQLFDIRFSSFMDEDSHFELLTGTLNDVYDSIEENPAAAVQVFDNYTERYQKVRNIYHSRLADVDDHIIRQNILVDNVLFTSPVLYKLDFFTVKKEMEEDYLLALTSGHDKKEQRQTFISSKIDLLSRVRYFLFNDQLASEDALNIVFVLTQDIKDLQEETLDDTAVNALFAKRLDDFGVFWSYLNTPEYSTTPLHGASHKERFEAFKLVQEQLLTFQDVKDQILGPDDKEELTVEEILTQVEGDLSSAGIQNIEFGFYQDVTKTKIPVLQAAISGIEFRGTYDWDRKLMSNIIVNDNLISQEGVKLSNVKKFILESISSKSPVITKTTPDDTDPQEDPLEDLKNAAKVFIVEKFSVMEMNISKSDIEVINFDIGEYKVEDVYFTENRSAKFSFTYFTKDDKVRDLTIQTDFGLKTVDDTFSPTFLKQVVLKIYDEARP